MAGVNNADIQEKEREREQWWDEGFEAGVVWAETKAILPEFTSKPARMWSARDRGMYVGYEWMRRHKHDT